MKKLTDICDIQYGYAFDSKCFTEDSSYPQLVRIRDVKKGYSETYYSGDYPEEYILSEGDLLVGMDGEFNIARWKCSGALLNQRVCRLTAKVGTNEEYLRFAMSKSLKEIEQRTAFVTVKHLSAKELNKLELDVPELSKQDKIADTLSRLERVIEARKEEMEKLDDLIKARFVEMFGDIATGNYKYDTRKLGDVANVGSSHRVFTTEFVKKGIPFYRGTEIGELANGNKPAEPFYISEEHYNRLVYNDTKGIYLEKEARAKYISEETFEKLKCTEIFPGDILVSRLPDPVGRACIIPEKEERMITAVDCTICRPNESIISKEYLCYFMRSSAYYKRLLGSVTGTTRKRISRKNLGNVELEVPSKERQMDVVEQLDCLVKVIESRKQELQLLDNLIKARFVEMFGNPVINEKRWRQKSLGEITTKIGSGATPKGGKGAYQEEGITLIRSMNVHNGLFEYRELAHISDEQAAKLDNVAIEENDVLLNVTGASVARSCVVPNKILPARVNQHVCIIRCKEYINPVFLNKLLIDDNYQDLLWSVAGAGATREAITKQQVERLQIIMPPVELQNEFMRFCNQVDKSKVVYQGYSQYIA